MRSELTFRETDLIIVLAFDVGKRIKPHTVSKWLCKRFKIFSEKDHSYALLAIDNSILRKDYIDMKRYARLALSAPQEISLYIKNQERLLRLPCRVSILLHSEGICIVTLWICIKNKEITLPDLMFLRNKILEDGVIYKEGSPHKVMDYIEKLIAPIEVSALFGGDDFNSMNAAWDHYCERKIPLRNIKKRNPFYMIFPVIFVNDWICSCGCESLDSLIHNHGSELAALLLGLSDYSDISPKIVTKVLEEGISYIQQMEFFLTASGGLGVTQKISDIYSKSKLDSLKKIYVAGIEFLVLMRYLVDTYDADIRMKMSYEKYESPYRMAKLRKDINLGLEEYFNIKFVNAEPVFSLIRYGREILGINEAVNVLLNRLSDLSQQIITLYEEQKSNQSMYIQRFGTLLSTLFGLLSIIGLLSFIFEVCITIGLPPIISFLCSLLIGLPLMLFTFLYIYRRYRRIHRFSEGYL